MVNCHICEKIKTKYTSYKFKLICSDCIFFFKNSVLFYNNQDNQDNQKQTIINNVSKLYNA
jgi:hypothetical protein